MVGAVSRLRWLVRIAQTWLEAAQEQLDGSEASRSARLGVRYVLVFLITMTVWAASWGQETAASGPGELAVTGEIILPRHPAPSPEGDRIAFSYQGDIWIVSRDGGMARRITAHPAYDGSPKWSPDGRWIAFQSDRDGNTDVYVIPVDGGRVRRLTWYSGSDSPTGWTPDSRSILFQSRRHVREWGSAGTFLVSVEGGMPVALIPTGARCAVLSPNGRHLAYQRGSEYWWKRGYEGNARYRLWLFETDEAIGAVAGDAYGEPRNTPERSSANSPESHDQSESGWSESDRTEPIPSEPIWTEPVCTNAGLLAKASLRPEGRYLNLTEHGGVTKLPGQGGPHGYLATYLSGPPDWSRPEVEVGSNSWPQWFPDGDHLLYMSEFHGVANLKVLSITGASRAWLTRFTEGRLRFPALSRDGSLATFEYEDGLYTVEIPRQLPAPGSTDWPIDPPTPRRLEIRIPIDERFSDLERTNVKSGATEMELSPDDKQIAFVYRGDIFAMKTAEDEPLAYRLTDSPARDDQIAWAPDSESLAFVSDRGGNRDIYLMRSTDEKETRLARTLHRETIRLTTDSREEWGPTFSPDGKQIAYLRGNGTLMIMNADGSRQKMLIDGWSDLAFEWSPDSKWLVYQQEDNDFNTDIFIISVEGKEEPHNISLHPDDDYSPCWSSDGRMIAFVSDREFLNQTDIWYVWLSLEDEERSREDRLESLSKAKDDHAKDNGKGSARDDDAGKASEYGDNADSDGNDDWNDDIDDEDGKGDEGDEGDEGEEEPIDIHIDFEDIHKRLHRLTTFPGDESRVLIARDMSGFVFVANTDGKRDLWWIKWDGSDPKRLTKGGQNPTNLQLDKKGKLIFYLKDKGTIASVPLKKGESKSYPYESKMMIDLSAQRGYVFDEAWRELNDHFYDSNFHGVDWHAMHEKYRPWAMGASTYRDFQDVIKLMMGELNCSHLGIWSGPDDWDRGSPGAQTGQLGVLFDPMHTGSGMRIVYVVEKTPADREKSRLEEGEIILSVNGVSVDPTVSLAFLLDHTVGKKTLLEVEDRSGKRREVVIRPISSGEMRDRLYDEEVEARRHFVDMYSNGRVAYIHIEGMSSTSLDLFERDLYAEAHGKEALLIDVRGNGGGWTTDLLLTSLLAGDHAYTIPRGGGKGYPQHRRLLYAWVKPAVILCNEHSFSNAEIFSWANRALGRALVVGQQTHGGVISTGGTTLADGAWLRLPFRKWISHLDGSNLEGTGCVPDIVVENWPGDMARGIDVQLQRALQEALEQIK